MKHLKKYLVLLLAGVLLTSSLVACNSSDGDSDDDDTEQTEKDSNGKTSDDDSNDWMSDAEKVEGSVGLEYADNGDNYIVMGIGTCTDTDLVIPKTYKGKPVATIYYDGDKGFQNLTSVVIPDSFTTVARIAFRNCTKLERVTLPDTITMIGERAFEGCESLERITLPASVTKIDIGAFGGCVSLERITIPASVTKIDIGAFSGCESLESVILEDPSGWKPDGDVDFSSPEEVAEYLRTGGWMEKYFGESYPALSD